MINKINLQDITSIAIKAGANVLEIYNQDFKIFYKDDNSP
ncbi:3'(2'), 5'-bisphosphate nucleotidase, partial [Campylobacter lari subsp. lari]